MRSDLTPAEQSLWKALRRIDLNGTHFRRQAPFGPYIVDFVCHRSRLIVEVEGGVHNHPAVAERDVRRETWLRQRGYTVLKFKNAEVLDHPEQAVQRIISIIRADTPAPNPSPQGGGES